MDVNLVGFNVILTATALNPSVFRESWLTANRFLEEGELQLGFAFTPQVAHVPTERYVLTVVPQQLQFLPATPELARELVPGLLADLVARIPHTPFRAVGVNFFWKATSATEPMAALSRRLFRSPTNVLAAAFDGAADAQWGAYISKDVDGARLKLDVKPSFDPETNEECLMAGFNFHRDLPPDEGAAVELRDIFGRWRHYEQIAEETMERLR